MRDRPLEAGLQEQASNHLDLRWLRARVVSVKEKAHRKMCQVRINGARQNRRAPAENRRQNRECYHCRDYHVRMDVRGRAALKCGL